MDEAEGAAAGERAFRAAVAALVEGAAPSGGHNLSGMAHDFDGYLWHAPELADVEVRSTRDPGALVVVTCRAAPGVHLRDAARAVARVWAAELSYQDGGVHRLVVGESEATFTFATRIDPPGAFYVTGVVTVRAG